MYMFNSTKPINDNEHIEATLSTILPNLKHENHVADAFVLNNNHLKEPKYEFLFLWNFTISDIVTKLAKFLHSRSTYTTKEKKKETSLTLKKNQMTKGIN